MFYEVAGTAKMGQDYVPLTGTLTIPAGAATADVVVTPLHDDELLEPIEDIEIRLLAGGYIIGEPASAQVILTNDTRVSRRGRSGSMDRRRARRRGLHRYES